MKIRNSQNFKHGLSNSYRGQYLSKMNFADRKFSSTSFEGASFIRCHFSNCRFQKCNLWSTKFASCLFEDCIFEDSVTFSSDFADSKLLASTLSNCHWTNVNCAGAQIRNIVVKNSVVRFRSTNGLVSINYANVENSNIGLLSADDSGAKYILSDCDLNKSSLQIFHSKYFEEKNISLSNVRIDNDNVPGWVWLIPNHIAKLEGNKTLIKILKNIVVTATPKGDELVVKLKNLDIGKNIPDILLRSLLNGKWETIQTNAKQEENQLIIHSYTAANKEKAVECVYQLFIRDILEIDFPLSAGRTHSESIYI